MPELITAPYRIAGLQNLEVEAGLFGNTYVLSNAELLVTYQSGPDSGKAVKLQVEDLPAGFTSKLSVDSGVPDFTTRFSVSSYNVAAGKYTPKITLRPECTNAVQEFPFDINIKPAISCSDYLLFKTYVRRFTRGTRGVNRAVTLILIDPTANLYWMDLPVLGRP